MPSRWCSRSFHDVLMDTLQSDLAFASTWVAAWAPTVVTVATHFAAARCTAVEPSGQRHPARCDIGEKGFSAMFFCHICDCRHLRSFMLSVLVNSLILLPATLQRCDAGSWDPDTFFVAVEAVHQGEAQRRDVCCVVASSPL